MINKFDDDVMKYLELKRKFKRHVENVYANNEDRMSFLESLCIGKAKEAIGGLTCLPDQNVAYERAWQRLDKRFGDSRNLMNSLQEQLLNGPSIKEWDGEALTKLCDQMYKCEVSFEAWGKDWLLNSQDLMHRLFHRLLYKVKSEFVLLSSSNGGSFRELRLLAGSRTV